MLCEQKGRFSRQLQRKLSERGRRMAKARWDKWRSEADTRPEPEPKMERWFRFEYAVKDKTTGEIQWRDLVSVRQAAKAMSLILKFL